MGKGETVHHGTTEAALVTKEAGSGHRKAGGGAILAEAVMWNVTAVEGPCSPVCMKYIGFGRQSVVLGAENRLWGRAGVVKGFVPTGRLRIEAVSWVEKVVEVAVEVEDGDNDMPVAAVVAVVAGEAFVVDSLYPSESVWLPPVPGRTED